MYLARSSLHVTYWLSSEPQGFVRANAGRGALGFRGRHRTRIRLISHSSLYLFDSPTLRPSDHRTPPNIVLASLERFGGSDEGGSSPPPAKKARLLSRPLETSSSNSSQGDMNGAVVHTDEAASEPASPAVNGCKELAAKTGHVANGVDVDHDETKRRILTKCDEGIIRIIGQYLRDMGFQGTVEELVHESGCSLEHPAATKFRRHVLAGEWNQAFEALEELKPLLTDPEDSKKMIFLLLEQKYMELLENRLLMDALCCLRNDITPLKYDTARVHKLSSYVMCGTAEELRSVADWPGVDGKSRELLMDNLQAFLPPSAMLPPKRLSQLLNQAVQRQADQCMFHNMQLEPGIEAYSLLTDHVCTNSQFPSECVSTLGDHSDEVLHVSFSHNGKRLASGSKDTSVIIWDTEDISDVRKHRVLHGHPFSVAWVAWSPDDRYIIACGEDESSEVYVWTAETGDLKCRISQSVEDSLTTAAWYSDSRRFAVAGIKGHFYQCDIEGHVLESWEGVRVQCLASAPHSQSILAADNRMRLRAYNFSLLTDRSIIQEDRSIMSFCVSSDGRMALLNIASQGLHLWDLQDKTLVRQYQGITQGYYTIHSCFGGVNEDFIASGSEDNKVYIWHRRQETPILVLTGHTRTVNAVSWNPTCPSMLASVGDDCYVKIWGPVQNKQTESHGKAGVVEAGVEEAYVL